MLTFHIPYNSQSCSFANIPDKIGPPCNSSITIGAYSKSTHFLELVLGPLIGKVTSSSALVLIELNQDVKYVQCVLTTTPYTANNVKSKTDSHTDTSTDSIQSVLPFVTAHKAVSFSFQNLAPGFLYYILLPRITGPKILGSFRTVPDHPTFSQVAVCGGYSPFGGEEIFELITDHIRNQQSMNLGGLKKIVNCWCETQEKNPLSHTNPNTLEGFIKNTNCSSTLTVHLGAQSVLTRTFPLVAEALIELGERLELPLSDASAVGTVLMMSDIGQHTKSN